MLENLEDKPMEFQSTTESPVKFPDHVYINGTFQNEIIYTLTIYQ